MKRNPLPGAGVVADDYSEESFADERTPLEEAAEEVEKGYLDDVDEPDDDHRPYSKPTLAWSFYSEHVKGVVEEIGQERYGDPAERGEWPFEIREQLADASREVTYQLIHGQGVVEQALQLSERATSGNDGRCHGYMNCCHCGACARRENGWGVRGDMPPTKLTIRGLVEKFLDKDPNRDPRGGSRTRGEQRALRTNHVSGRLHRYDFTKRQSGRGKAGADRAAISEWLTGRVVRGKKDDRLWLTEEKIREVADYGPVFEPGRRSKAVQPLYLDLVHRVATLVESGAQRASIARELDVSEKTIGRMIKDAKRLKPLR